ncbi:MAG: hypothetical protein PW734_07090 [Verrucomicrobium sp.]|nr:hypothetical protein [Verrucomicrobium sp.]
MKKDLAPGWWPHHLPDDAWVRAAQEIRPPQSHFNAPAALLRETLEDRCPRGARSHVIRILSERAQKENFPLHEAGSAFRLATALIERKEYHDLAVLAAAPGTREGKWNLLATLIYSSKGWHHYPVRAEDQTQEEIAAALKPAIAAARKGTDLDYYVLKGPQGEAMTFTQFFQAEERADQLRNLGEAIFPKNGLRSRGPEIRPGDGRTK